MFKQLINTICLPAWTRILAFSCYWDVPVQCQLQITHRFFISDAPTFQPSLTELFRSPLRGCVTLPQNVTLALSLTVLWEMPEDSHRFRRFFRQSPVVPTQLLHHFGHCSCF